MTLGKSSRARGLRNLLLLFGWRGCWPVSLIWCRNKMLKTGWGELGCIVGRGWLVGCGVLREVSGPPVGLGRVRTGWCHPPSPVLVGVWGVIGEVVLVVVVLVVLVVWAITTAAATTTPGRPTTTTTPTPVGVVGRSRGRL
ncbi:hypothetical protein HanRHA438_Chr08g0360121 [Helianthus annuus]|uniref:Uncharacterized protein n=1 Tax=Helianthus annuus TaxID=4232 RepID=A0A251U8N3_HELAN|nr:hypothetical protein HanXRQr2_Chr08g0347841 [Helianthus annuus]KAJ0554241.1 hypothetical protein HanHA89_Chr08g0305461 [Helianthus annuus]KAJ0898729.1 hypothetical protein HanRHA438_Chr08g0360121 [Helianthus annuus]KAJ0902362.1 hypothetical protein HanPSC8_Chr08g0336111 [Helianthus annuus]